MADQKPKLLAIDDHQLLLNSAVAAHHALPEHESTNTVLNNVIDAELCNKLSSFVSWTKVDDIDGGLATDFDGSLQGLGVEVQSDAYDMSEALLALPVFKQENLDYGFQYILMSPTSPATKLNEETVTYLNQGMSYEVKLKSYGNANLLKPAKKLTSVIRVVFHERRLQYMEKEQLNYWRTNRPGERILDLDVPLSYGISDVKIDDDQLNCFEFSWYPTPADVGVYIKVNCISTEFTAKKHGGEKGVPFRLQIDTYDSTAASRKRIYCASCQVKVFKPKGADRKHKTDREKMEKRSEAEKLKYQPSYDCTVLTEIPLDQITNYSGVTAQPPQSEEQKVQLIQQHQQHMQQHLQSPAHHDGGGSTMSTSTSKSTTATITGAAAGSVVVPTTTASAAVLQVDQNTSVSADRPFQFVGKVDCSGKISTLIQQQPQQHQQSSTSSSQQPAIIGTTTPTRQLSSPQHYRVPANQSKIQGNKSSSKGSSSKSHPRLKHQRHSLPLTDAYRSVGDTSVGKSNEDDIAVASPSSAATLGTSSMSKAVPSPPAAPALPHSQPSHREELPPVLTQRATALQVTQWLHANRFSSHVHVFQNFAGSDLLRLSRDDLIQICGLADGIRLNNALQSKNLRPRLTIYVCQETQQSHQHHAAHTHPQHRSTHYAPPPPQQVRQHHYGPLPPSTPAASQTFPQHKPPSHSSPVDTSPTTHYQAAHTPSPARYSHLVGPPSSSLSSTTAPVTQQSPSPLSSPPLSSSPANSTPTINHKQLCEIQSVTGGGAISNGGSTSNANRSAATIVAVRLSSSGGSQTTTTVGYMNASGGYVSVSGNPPPPSSAATSTAVNTSALASKRMFDVDSGDDDDIVSSKKQRTRCLEMFKKAYHALYLEDMTVESLVDKIANLYSITSEQIIDVYQHGPGGIIVLVTDEVVSNFKDLSLFAVDAVEDDKTRDKYKLIMRALD